MITDLHSAHREPRHQRIRSARTSLLALFLIIAPGTVSAQTTRPGTDEPRRLKRSLDQTDPAALERLFAATDRAVAAMDLSDLVVYTYNFGNTISGRIYSSGRAHYPNAEGRSRGFIFESSPAFAVPAGPWHPTPIVHENSNNHSTTKLDWEARDGSRGELFSTPQWDYPVFATSDQPMTWPHGGTADCFWPAPEDDVAVWWGTTTWRKWRRVADRECYGIFDDAYADREGDGQSKPLGIEVRFRALQNADRDIVFFQYEFHNLSDWHFTDLYLGQIVDSGSPTVNDRSGARLRYDCERQLVYAVGACYDSLSGTHGRPYEDGSCSVTEPLGWVGTLWLETPTGSFKQDETGAPVDDPDRILTRLALLDYSDRIVDNEGAIYGALSGDISLMTGEEAGKVWKTDSNGGQPVLLQDEADFMTAYPSWSTGADLYYYAASGPLTMAPGESVDYILAYVGGQTEPQLLATADEAIRLFADQYTEPSAPSPPSRLRANGVQAGPHGKDYDPRIHRYPITYTPGAAITLSWDGQNSLASSDRDSEQYDFEGFRLYRSLDRGRSWGTARRDDEGNLIGWVPLARWDLANGITGTDPLSGLDLGTDSGLEYTWTDTTAREGIEYWYAVTGYDHGERQNGIQLTPALESEWGTSPESPTVVAVIASSRPAGYEPGAIEDVTGEEVTILPAADSRSASIRLQVTSEAEVAGHTYRLEITPTASSGSYLNVTNHPHRAGLSLRDLTMETTLFALRSCSIPDQDDGWSPVFDGCRFEVTRPNRGNGGVFSVLQTVDVDPDTSFSVRTAGACFAEAGPEYNRASLTGFMDDCELRFTGWLPAGSDSSRAHDAVTRGAVRVPFEIRDIDSGVRLYPVVIDSAALGPPWNTISRAGEWDGTDRIVITNVPYADAGGDPTDFSSLHPPTDDDYWLAAGADSSSRSDWIYELGFAERDRDHALWSTGDVWILRPYRTLKYHVGESFEFSTSAPQIVNDDIDLSRITVVPNPYCVSAAWDSGENDRKIQFRNVPADCRISIYTLSGELITILDHHGSALDVSGARGYNSDRIGTVDWNLWSYEFMEVSYGLYLYVVKTDDGRQRVGKFAIIR